MNATSILFNSERGSEFLYPEEIPKFLFSEIQDDFGVYQEDIYEFLDKNRE
jgi:hypothetical protein